MSLIKNISSPFYSVLATNIIELDSSSTISLPTCHSARRACPKLQNPLPHFEKKKLLPGDKVPARADEGCEKVLLSGPYPPSAPAPPLPEAEGYFLDYGFCDFAFGSAQNDRNGRHIVKSESIRTGETRHKGV